MNPFQLQFSVEFAFSKNKIQVLFSKPTDKLFKESVYKVENSTTRVVCFSGCSWGKK